MTFYTGFYDVFFKYIEDLILQSDVIFFVGSYLIIFVIHQLRRFF